MLELEASRPSFRQTFSFHGPNVSSHQIPCKIILRYARHWITSPESATTTCQSILAFLWSKHLTKCTLGKWPCIQVGAQREQRHRGFTATYLDLSKVMWLSQAGQASRPYMHLDSCYITDVRRKFLMARNILATLHGQLQRNVEMSMTQQLACRPCVICVCCPCLASANCKSIVPKRRQQTPQRQLHNKSFDHYSSSIFTASFIVSCSNFGIAGTAVY